MKEINWLPWQIGDEVQVFYDPSDETEVREAGTIEDIVRLPNDKGIGRYKIRTDHDDLLKTRSIKSYYFKVDGKITS